MIRFASLGSGSRGNALIIEANGTRVLLDCGFSLKETTVRMERLGLSPESIDAILVTHEHMDHAGGVGVLARKYGLPVWMTHGTQASLEGSAAQLLQGVTVHLFETHQRFALGGVEVSPYPVPHDAREPSQFVFSDGDLRLGVLTDTGSSTPHIESMLSNCDALFLECNHDLTMLRDGPYPPVLKQRVGGPFGHLENGSAAELLRRINTRALQHVVAAHLSDKNNRPELARMALGDALGCQDRWIDVADQEQGLDWREVV